MAALGAATVVLPALASSEPPTIEAVNYKYLSEESHYWSPSSATIAEGGQVVFKNSSSTVPHGLEFTGGPGKPVCSGLPAGASEKTGAVSWQGSCTFSAAGTYSFICTVHPSTMKGTITVGPAGTTTTTTTTTGTTTGLTGPGGTGTTPPPYTSPGSGGAVALLVGGSAALQLATPRHATSVHGSLDVAAAGAGGTLEVELLASARTLGGHGSAKLVVGKLLRYYISSGKQSFTVALSSRARRTLRRHRRLALTARISLTAAGATPLTLTRALVLHS